MTTLRRRSLLLLAAALVLVAGAGDSSDETRDQRRARIENMTSRQKQELLEAFKRFQKLPREKREELVQLHDDLQAHENRDELIRVMDAYYEWIRLMSSSGRLTEVGRQELEKRSPQERIRFLAELKKSSHARSKRRGPGGGFGGPGFGGAFSGRGVPVPSKEEFEGFRHWAAAYVAEHGDDLAAALPVDVRANWKAAWQSACTVTEEQARETALWRVVLAWFLAEPQEAFPILEDGVRRFESQLPEEISGWFARLSPEQKRRIIRLRLGYMAGFQFALNLPNLEGLVADEELEDYRRNQLDTKDRAHFEGLAEGEAETKLRLRYFLWKARHTHERDEGVGPSRGRGGSGWRGGGESRREGRPELRGGPGRGFSNRFGPAPDKDRRGPGDMPPPLSERGPSPERREPE